MSDQLDLLITGAEVWTTGGPVITDVGISNGYFSKFGDLISQPAKEIIDAKNLTLLPGVIDTQVHFREPGLEHKEDIESGTRGAALGGVVGIFEMPNTNPPTISQESIKHKLSIAEDNAWVDFAFFVGAAEENTDELNKLEMLRGVSGVKMFMGASTGSLLVYKEEQIRQVLRNGFRRIAVHCEDQERLQERANIISGKTNVSEHAVWRDVQTALKATKNLIRLAREARRRVHTLHITTAEEMHFLKDHRDIATVEVLPQHLTLSAPEAYERLGTLAQMNPPIRSAYHQEELWRSVRDGLVDCIGSDHAPHTLDEKNQPYPKSPSGLTGVQTLVPIMLNHVNQGRISLARMVDLTSYGPAKIYGLVNKGRIALGYDADLTIVDLKSERKIDNNWIVSKSKWTPYDGMSVKGWPVSTVVRGKVIMRESEICGVPSGKEFEFAETLRK